MTSTKYELKQFTRVDNFRLWQLKMHPLLVQQGLLETLEGESKLDASMDKKTWLEKAWSAILDPWW